MNQVICRVHAGQRGTKRFGLETVAKDDFGIYARPPAQRLRSPGDAAHEIAAIFQRLQQPAADVSGAASQ